jgi:antitoxin (DNA-binding transcriptional repressor) of toxin-antitoxin stability system
MRQRLGEILDAASAGERILIERDHRPIACLVSVEVGQRLDEAAEDLRERRLAALDRLEALARRIDGEGLSRSASLESTTAVRRDRDRDDTKATG